MKKNFTFFLLFIYSKTLFAQISYYIQGRVLDTDNQPIPYATLFISYGGNTEVQQFKTDSIGHFKKSLPRKQSYSLKIQHLEYEPDSTQIPADSLILRHTLQIPPIYLRRKNNTLDEVTVTASKTVVKQEIDRISYEVETDPDSRTESLFDLMRKVPTLSIDGEDNLRMKGTGNFKILINGRPSSLFSKSPKEALRAMPANSVKRIEVMTTPPAKYDAEGLSGIINLVMHKPIVDGYNASLGFTYNNTVGTEENMTLTGKKGKFGVTARGYFFQDFKRHLETNMDRTVLQSMPSKLTQSGLYSFIGNYFMENMEISFEADSLHLLTANVDFVNSHYDDQTTLTASTVDDDGENLQSYRSLNLNPQLEKSINADFNYQLGFRDRKNQFFTFSYHYLYAPSNQQNTVLFNEQVNHPLSDYYQDNQSKTREHTVQVDYVQPRPHYTFDGGAKIIFRQNGSDYTNQQLISEIRDIPEVPAFNTFNYNQRVYSLYHSSYFKWKSVEMKAGLRLEHTTVNTNFTDQITGGTHYSNLIPVLSIQRKIGQGNLNLGYTNRINRPGINQLNPFINQANPQFVQRGNPNLQATVSNVLELTYSRYTKGNLTIGLNYAFSNNTVQAVTTLEDSISYTNYQNIGKDRSVGLNASIYFPFTKKLSLTINSQLSHLWIEGFYDSHLFSNHGLQGYVYAQINYLIGNTWRAGISTTYSSPSIYLQGSTNGYVNQAFRLSKELFNKKFLITAAVSNPYGKYRYVHTTTLTPDFEQVRTSQRFYRSINLGINYRFGNMQSEIKQNQRGIKNNDVVNKKGEKY